MPHFKIISKESIPAALEKAIQYRLLNQPLHAESICRDILKTDPDNQQVIYTLVLAITDQFERKAKSSIRKALEIVEQLTDNYQREYCTGLIYERQGTAAVKRQTPRSGYISFDYISRAMEFYEKAEKIRPEKNEESILRWNSCLRFMRMHNLKPSPEEKEVQPFLDV